MAKDFSPIEKHIGDYFLNENTNLIPPELQEWIDESEENRLRFEAYRKIWNRIDKVYAVNTFDAKAAWRKTNKANCRNLAGQKRKIQIIYTVSGIAASILLLVSLASLYFTGRSSSPATAVEIETGYGNRSSIVLPDGTHVRLNANSKISYSYNAAAKIREVNFNGEGFFEVAKDKSPLVITTPDGLQIKVLGTTFNLSAYKDDETIETTLIEGAIEMDVSGDKLLLKPGETGMYDKTNNVLKPVDKTAAYAYGWLNDKIYMDNMPLSKLCEKLERMYDVNITLHNNIGEKIRYNGVIREENINDVLDALQKLSNIKYKIKGKNISLMPK
ncbi:MAG: DUF4974 domain-containing protein [Dysgonamonadaceae bacterium]|jgi:ferric-dicitrate binding protein FerR (iron transport regulator)|nr:DUF4974 domain-containing protein [Dysgonamonadaceae bacterium]